LISDKRLAVKIIRLKAFLTTFEKHVASTLLDGIKAGIHMTVAGTIVYKFLAYSTYLHVYNLTGMPVYATQVDSTTFDLLAYNLREGGRGGLRNRHVS
jgi:hypothetical protein